MIDVQVLHPFRTQVCPDSGSLGMATTPSQRGKAEDLLLHQSRADNKRFGGSAANPLTNDNVLKRKL
jgi:hypothetical protein